jgi:hypothetical protein
MRKIKYPLANHSNVDVRLMCEFLVDALAAAKAGDVELTCTRIRIAARLEKDVPAEFSLGLKEAA